MPNDDLIECACGCGEMFAPRFNGTRGWKRFVAGHTWRGKKLSKEHRQQIATGTRGKPRPNRRKVRRAHRSTRWDPDYYLWRNAVLSRDNDTCQHCGLHATQTTRDRELHVHHIKSWKDYPDLRFEVDNGLTLCVPCHLVVHGNKGFRSRKQRPCACGCGEIARPGNRYIFGHVGRGRPRPQHVLDALAAANKGRRATPETRAKLSLALRGRTVTAETRAKLSATFRGRTVSAETRAKLSAKARLRRRKPEPGISGAWALAYEHCTVCGRTDSHHSARGVCHRCYNRLRDQRLRQDAHRPPRSTQGERNGRAKLTPEQVSQIRDHYASGATRAVLAREYGVNWSTVDAIVRGVGWRHM